MYNNMYQFGCGILKMVGPKKQDFWPKINILQGNHCIYQLIKNISIFDPPCQHLFTSIHRQIWTNCDPDPFKFTTSFMDGPYDDFLQKNLKKRTHKITE